MDRERSNQDISCGTSEVKILISGAGGQGVLLMGKILSQSFLLEEKQVTWFPSYGAEVRGGTCKCMVVASSQEIASPYVTCPDYLIVMNEPSYIKYAPAVDSKGVLFYNQSLLKENVLDAGIKNVSIPVTEMALKIGDIRCANMVMLGCFINYTKIVKVETVEEVLPIVIRHKETLGSNIEALKQGYNYE
ncbi:MAG: 2-oxoacid:acceptor oxidoreductase family protein [Candidatus Saelkia tenebricola]|nr:2-oxoacid:acceptor oxidoreductase family protein [Candidatus Saelkia tenebricola]